MKDASSHRREAGRNVHLPRVEKLKPGDVLLTSNVAGTSRKGGKQSELIRTASRGRFSHALICSEPPVLIEAIGHGVSTLSLVRCFAHARDNVRVLRYPDASVAQHAGSLAQLEVGRDYSVLRAVQSVFSSDTLARVNDHGVFCSALVAQAFRTAGAPEFAATPVDKTTPATIDQMAGMVDVTDEIFLSSPAPSNVDKMTALDGDAAPTLSSQQTEISNRYAKAALPAAERLVQEHPYLGLEVVPTLYGLLDLILRARDVASAAGPPSNAALTRAVGDLDGQLGDLIASGEMLRLLQDVARADDQSNQKALRESFGAHPDIDANSMRGFLETTRRELAVRRAAYDQMAGWENGRSRANSEYLKLESLVISTMATREPLLEEILKRIS